MHISTISIVTVIIIIIIGILFFIFAPKISPFHKMDIEELPEPPAVDPEYLKTKTFKVVPLNECKYANQLGKVERMGLIILPPKFTQKKQFSHKLVNTSLRYMYCLQAGSAKRSSIWIDGERRYFEEKKWVVADFSREYSFENINRMQPVVLFFADVKKDKIGCSMSVKCDEIMKEFIEK